MFFKEIMLNHSFDVREAETQQKIANMYSRSAHWVAFLTVMLVQVVGEEYAASVATSARNTPPTAAAPTDFRKNNYHEHTIRTTK